MSGVPTILEVLREACDRLTHAGLSDSHLDAGWLLAHVLKIQRGQLAARGQQRIPPDAASRFAALVDERATGRPLAHLLGEWEFYGLALFVNEHVLVPRPETELLVDQALSLTMTPRRIADLGTGSGCLAIALATQFPHAEVHATEISPAALAVARENVARHALADRVHLHQGDLLIPLDGVFDLIVSNPPYVAAGDPELDPHVARFEPHQALFDPDGDGLGYYRRIAVTAPQLLGSGGTLLLEIGNGQAPAIKALFEEARHPWHLRIANDLAGIQRCVVATI